MESCDCEAEHGPPRRVVLTGGPGAGKTAVLELVRKLMCPHVAVLPESAGILFGGGFPRWNGAHAQMCTQRAIYHVQRELEQLHHARGELAIALCDRGTIDGLAYWPGDPDELWVEVGTTREAELARYDVVVHLRVPAAAQYRNDDGVRIESHAEASAIDARIERAWASHPRRRFVESTPDFLEKARHALDIIRAELPGCCRAMSAA